MTTPTIEGFYWGKWRSAAPGTADNGEPCRGDDAEWEVVEVFENGGDGDEYFMANVPGVEKAQGLHRFEWSDTGRLIPPAS